MKKIMFNDKYFLTQAVLVGQKTMTRRKFARFEPDARMFDEICNIEGGFDDKGRYIFTLYNENGDIIGDMIPHYNVGEIVAIAQPYKDIIEYLPMYSDAILGIDGIPHKDFKAGWTNKMFVKADLMPHHIKITDIKVERLQDISDNDCLCEGIKFRYVNMNFGNSLTREDYYYEYLDRYGEKDYYGTNSPKNTFSILIDKICGYDTWESNPLVVVYSFELLD